MAIPDYQTLMLPVLKLAAEGEKRVADVVERIADDFGLSPQEREELLPSGRQRVLHNRIHWAKFYLGKAGLVSSPGRGRWVATDAGRALLAQNPSKIDVKLLLQRQEFRDFYRDSAPPDGDSEAVQHDVAVTAPKADATTPEEQIEAVYHAVLAADRSDLLERIGQNSPAFFEGLIVDLLVAMGYGGSHKDAATQLGRSGDGGVDGVVNEDRLGLDRIYVQAKRYASTNSIGRGDVQAFVGSLVGFRATKGVFVTTSTFSHHAHEYVKNLPQRVVLIDGYNLADLMIEHGIGVRVSREIQFNRVDEDFFSGLTMSSEDPDRSALADGLYWYAEKLMWGYEDVTRNEREAVRLYRRAAALGHSDSAIRVGQCLEFGRGVDADPEAAITSYKNAAKAGNFFALAFLAQLVSRTKTRTRRSHLVTILRSLGSPTRCSLLGGVGR